MTADGKVYTAGDVKSQVSIQSIAEDFAMAQVIDEQRPNAIAKLKSTARSPGLRVFSPDSAAHRHAYWTGRLLDVPRIAVKVP